MRASGPILVLLAEVVACRAGGIPGLSALILAAVVYGVLVGGIAAGLVGGAIELVYYAYDESIPGAPLHYMPWHLERVLVTTGGIAIAVLLLGRLHANLGRHLSHERALRSEADDAHRQVTDILERITDGFFAVDRAWRFTYANRTAERLVRKSREELLGAVMWEAFPALVGSPWDGAFRRALAEQAPVALEAYYPPLETWFETRAYPSADGLTIYLTDVTQRRRTQEALEARFEQRAALAAMGVDALRHRDPRALMDAAVARIASTLGVDAAKVLELLPGGETLLLRAGVGWKEGYVGRATVDAGHDSQAGYTLASREPVIVEDARMETRFTFPPLLVEHGLVCGISVLIGDVEHPWGVLGAHMRQPRRFTSDDVNFVRVVANLIALTVARARADADLRESEARFRQIAENLHETTWLADEDDKAMLYVSPAYEEIWGRSREDLFRGRWSWLDGVHPEDRARMEALSRGPERFETHEFRIVKPDGAVRWVEARAFPVKDPEGGVSRVAGVARDVTAAKEAEAAAIRLAAAEAGVQARDQVLAVVSHDLRNPLHTIRMGARLLERPLPEAQRGRQIQIIERCAERMSRLIEDLLDVARLEAGRMTVKEEDVALEPLFAEARAALEQEAAERLLCLRIEAAEGITVRADRGRVLQVLTNLVGNAMKFTPEGGSIVVRAEPAGPDVRVAVSDTGPGIPAEQIPRLFERFWQARAGDVRGAGLGLSIVKGIVEAHGGRVWVESERGEGTTVYFTLRATESPVRCAGSRP